MHLLRRIIVAVSLLTLCSGAIGQSTKKPQTAPTPTTETPDAAKMSEIAYSSLSESLRQCSLMAQAELVEANAKLRLAIAVRQANNPDESRAVSSLQAQNSVAEDKSRTGWKYKQCVSEKEAFATGTVFPDYVKSFQLEKNRSLAKAVAAAWLSAMDEIGSNDADSAAARFREAVNKFKIELATS